MNGLLLVDKPSGVTSHDVVDHVRRATGMRRIGHTGTLDPAATGLLILCVGAATRLSDFLVGMDKVYEGAMRFGLVTDSYDLDGKVVEERPVPELSEADIQSTFDRFTGEIQQVPPMVSAVKVGGERLYKLARRGETVEREPRPVTVKEFLLLDYQAPDAMFRLRCTRGTYARTLCFDVGEALGCGGTLALLRRTWVGHHCVDQAAKLDDLQARGDVETRLLSADDALDMPHVTVRPASRRTALSGALLGADDLAGGCPTSEGWVQIKSERGELLALGEILSTPGGPRVQPKRVLSGPR